MKNPCGKTRGAAAPYASWTNPRTGWNYKLLKSYQADNSKPYARWFVDVEGFEHALGDEYVGKMLSGLQSQIISGEVVFDTTIWPTQKDFYNWAWGRE